MDLTGHRLFVFEPGIWQKLGVWKNWYKLALTATNVFAERNGLPWRADYSEYFCTAIGRAFRQGARITNLGRLLGNYGPEVDRGLEIHLVGHSNGAAVILGVFSDYPDTHISKLHLVCPACEADFNRNCLNQLLDSNIGEVRVYLGGQDKALRLAHTIFGKLLGYGDLGLHGPQNVLPSVQSRVKVIRWLDYGHSTCWETQNFADTMGYFWGINKNADQVVDGLTAKQ